MYSTIETLTSHMRHFVASSIAAMTSEIQPNEKMGDRIYDSMSFTQKLIALYSMAQALCTNQISIQPNVFHQTLLKRIALAAVCRVHREIDNEEMNVHTDPNLKYYWRTLARNALLQHNSRAVPETTSKDYDLWHDKIVTLFIFLAPAPEISPYSLKPQEIQTLLQSTFFFKTIVLVNDTLPIPMNHCETLATETLRHALVELYTTYSLPK